MQEFLKTTTLTFFELFKTRVFRIPEYQRNYEWGEEQIDTLWSDLLVLVENLKDEKPSYHFFGPVFVTKPANEPSSPDGWHDLIDGQQRLTTVQILLHCLRERLEGST